MMHSDSRVKEPVCLATTSLPDPCLSTYLSPRFREEPKKTGVCYAFFGFATTDRYDDAQHPAGSRLTGKEIA